MALLDLDKRITFQKKTVSKTSSGVEQSTWTDSFSVWASKYVKGISVRTDDHSSTPETTIEWSVYYRDDIDYSLRIKYGGDIYKIEFIDEVEEKFELKITTTVVKKGGKI